MATESLRKPHLILVGLPGAGKSTVGRQVASKLGRSFLDFDEEIEKREGKTIAEIFAADGEAYFRKCEHSLTESLVPNEGMVLSPGAGWVCDAANVQRVRPPGHLVYLRVSPEVALARMGAAAASRPLLKRTDPVGDLRRLYADREKFYMESDLVVDTELVDIEALTELICDYTRTVELVYPAMSLREPFGN